MRCNTCKKLFWQIVKCGNVATARSNPNHPCHKIVSLQSNPSLWQCPEPWVGSLESASIMFISSNPSIDVDEVYPIVGGPNGWSCNDVEVFFEDRFSAIHKSSGMRYVSNDYRPLKCVNGKYVYGHPVRYWKSIFKKYANSLIDSVESPNPDIVLTEVVHCKSQKEKGVSKALKQCLCCTKRIVEEFASHNGTFICVVGQKAKQMFLEMYCGSSTIIQSGFVCYTLKGKGYSSDLYVYSINNCKIKVAFVPHPNARLTSLIINGVKII